MKTEIDKYKILILLQDIVANDEIKLDWIFKKSLIADLANVSICRCFSS